MMGLGVRVVAVSAAVDCAREVGFTAGVLGRGTAYGPLEGPPVPVPEPLLLIGCRGEALEMSSSGSRGALEGRFILIEDAGPALAATGAS